MTGLPVRFIECRWVAVHIVYEVLEVTVGKHVTGLKRPKKQVSLASMSRVEVHRVGRPDFPHKRRDTPIFNLFHYQMEVIRHQAERANGDQCLDARNLQYFFKFVYPDVSAPRGNSSFAK